MRPCLNVDHSGGAGRGAAGAAGTIGRPKPVAAAAAAAANCVQAVACAHDAATSVWLSLASPVRIPEIKNQSEWKPSALVGAAARAKLSQPFLVRGLYFQPRRALVRFTKLPTVCSSSWRR